MNLRQLVVLLFLVSTSLVDGLPAQQNQDAPRENSLKKKAEKTKQVQAGAKPKAGKQKKQLAGQNKQSAKPDEPLRVLQDIEMKDINGKKVSLEKYEGKVVLIVNVASKCGFTGQYKPLQDLHTKYNQHGLEVVAFPCNQFGRQEPASEKAINAFCKEKFGIEFDMFAKVDVKGKKQAELFRRLTSCDLAPVGKGAIRWNFEKFLIGKDGKPLARFRSNVPPRDKTLVARLEQALGLAAAAKEETGSAPVTESNSKTAKQPAVAVETDKK